MKTLKDLFHHEIKDLYSAEKQLLEALPKMVEGANSQKLKDAFEHHRKETKTQFERLKAICDDLDINPTSTVCDAMRGLIKECEHMLKENADPAVKDAALIACAQRCEHYEISAYGTAYQYAKTLGHSQIAETLQKTLDEEYEADQKLDDLAIKGINKKAMEVA